MVRRCYWVLLAVFCTGAYATWASAIKADKISISDYGDNVRHEDLAEFAQVYAVCLDAGPEPLAALEELSPARFALWEKILKGSDGD